MKVILSGRRAGKTTKMIEWLRGDARRLLITFSRQEAERLHRAYEDVSTRITDWDSYRERRLEGWRMHPKEVAIDNADIVLQSQVRDDLKIITISEDEHDRQKKEEND